MSRWWRRAGSAPAMSGRNTTIIRSNYLLPGNIPFYEWSMKLWEGLEQDINYNAMVSQRGVLNLYHSDAQRDAFARRGNAMRLHGVDAELLDRDGVRAMRAVPRFRQCALSDPGRPAAAARRHGAPRRGRLGLCARRRPARRRHHPELRGHRHPASRTAASSASRRRAASSARTRSGSRSPATRRASRRWPACGCRSRAMCCRPSSRKALKPLIDRRHHLRRRAFLCQPVRQGRPRVRRRHRRLQLLCPARQSAGRRGCLRRRHGADAGDRPRCACCAPGAASWTCRWTARRSSTARRSTASISMPAGATAASRRRRPRAGASRTDRARRAASASRRAYRLDRFATGRADRREGRRRPAQPALRSPCASPVPIAASATRRSSPISATPALRAPRRRWRRRRGAMSSTTSICATIRPARIASSGITRRLPRLAGGDARHAHACDLGVEPARTSR